MKKFLLSVLGVCLLMNTVSAKTYTCPDEMLKNKEVKVLTKGEPIPFPLPDGAIIECYAKRIDGSVDDFEEYNDYFVSYGGKLYSNTMHKIYKPEKAEQLKKVDQAKIVGKKTLQLYDPLWEGSIRHHVRVIKINTETGEYYMKGFQDNWMWYRNITTTGYCRVIYPKQK